MPFKIRNVDGSINKTSNFTTIFKKITYYYQKIIQTINIFTEYIVLE